MSEVDRFLDQGRSRWDLLDLVARQQSALSAADWSDLSRLYRALCADLARARSLDVPDEVLIYLDDLAGRAHNRLYRSRIEGHVGVLRFVMQDIPAEVRAQWRWCVAAAALFYGPWILCMGLALISPELAAQVVSADQLRQVEQMYSDAPSRTFGEDAAMAGFYVWNNVGIAFRCFATGAMFGLGSLFFLVYNGSVLGTIFGHVIAAGNGLNLLEFTCGHSAWELNGIVVAGAAGMRMGWAMIDTGGLTRVASLRAAGPVIYRLITGAAVMISVAAAIEGFWSASDLGLPVKLAFAAAQVLAVGLWIGLSGRRTA